jgi:GNAT superfamily N-acetyltransferase
MHEAAECFPFSDLELSRRLERAEGHACAQYAVARRKVFPESGAEWMQCGGAFAVFDGVDSPVTQTFGVGVFEEWRPECLKTIEQFFLAHGAPVLHEVSPFAGIEILQSLCIRHYRPLELSNVMYRPVVLPRDSAPSSSARATQSSESEADIESSVIRQSNATARMIHAHEAQRWSELSARGWAQEHPEFFDFLLQLGVISAAREDSVCFIGEVDGRAGAAGVLSIHGGVALFGGSATVPEMRHRGLQSALLRERMHYAHEHGCDLAMMVAQPGTASQRNAERRGFRIAYTRIKWELTEVAA